MLKPIIAAALLLSATGALAYSADVYVVCNLDPNGDNFLALRAGPSSGTRMIMPLPPGVAVEEWGRQGNWMEVVVQIGGRPSGYVYAGYLCLAEDH